MQDLENRYRDNNYNKEPVLNIPAFLVIVIALLSVIYIAQEYILAEETRDRFMVSLAFSPLRYVFPLGEQDLAWLWSPITYSFLHGSVEHLLFNVLWLMAFGAPVVRRIGAVRTIFLWGCSAAAAAFFHAILNWGSPSLLVGSSGVVSALMGAACRFAFQGPRVFDRTSAHVLPRQSIFQSLGNRTVLVFTGMWFAGNIFIAVGVTFIDTEIGSIAWDAHIGGFLWGFLFFSLFDIQQRRQARA